MAPQADQPRVMSIFCSQQDECEFFIGESLLANTLLRWRASLQIVKAASCEGFVLPLYRSMESQTLRLESQRRIAPHQGGLLD